MDTNDPQIEQPGCGDSSSGGDASCSSASGAQSNWKTAVFIAVLVLAGVVAGRSVLMKNGGNGGTSPCGSRMGSPCCPLTTPQPDIAAKTYPQTAAWPSEAVCPKTGACPMEKAGCPSEGTPPAGCPQAALSSCCPNQGNGDSTEAKTPEPGS